MANNEVETGKKPEMVEPEVEGGGQYLLEYPHGVSSAGSNEDEVHSNEESLMAAVIETENMWEALRRVKRNHGAVGVDGMTVEELPTWLKHHWVMIRRKLLEGSYQPQAVRQVAIPKPDGGERILGIPAVLERGGGSDPPPPTRCSFHVMF